MKYFKEALTQFSQDVAVGGAIRHLADIGYTARQITGSLDFPAPYEKVQEIMWQHLLDGGVILLEEPGEKTQREKGVFVKEYGKYGRTSFRLKTVSAGDAIGGDIRWREYRYQPAMGELSSFLQAKRREDGERGAYASLDMEKLRRCCKMLQPDDAEYLNGFPEEVKRIYHRLDERMCRILCELYRQGTYEGTLYFAGLCEKILIPLCPPIGGR